MDITVSDAASGVSGGRANCTNSNGSFSVSGGTSFSANLGPGFGSCDIDADDQVGNDTSVADGYGAIRSVAGSCNFPAPPTPTPTPVASASIPPPPSATPPPPPSPSPAPGCTPFFKVITVGSCGGSTALNCDTPPTCPDTCAGYVSVPCSFNGCPGMTTCTGLPGMLDGTACPGPNAGRYCCLDPINGEICRGN